MRLLPLSGYRAILLLGHSESLLIAAVCQITELHLQEGRLVGIEAVGHLDDRADICLYLSPRSPAPGKFAILSSDDCDIQLHSER